jgi:hypothetical protein
MATKTLRPKASIGKTAVLFVAGASVLALITSALTAINDVAFQGLHSFSLVVMLLAFLGLIAQVLSKRMSPVVKVSVRELEEKTSDSRAVYQLVPSRYWNFICLEPRSLPGKAPCAQPLSEFAGFESLKRIYRHRNESISAVILRNTYIDIDVLETLLQFPNVVVIDIQGCRVDNDIWSEFACFPMLEYLAVHGAVDSQSERDLHYSLPEVKAILEPVVFVHSSPDTL